MNWYHGKNVTSPLFRFRRTRLLVVFENGRGIAKQLREDLVAKMKNYYEVLNVTESASPSELKKSYKKLALKVLFYFLCSFHFLIYLLMRKYNSITQIKLEEVTMENSSLFLKHMKFWVILHIVQSMIKRDECSRQDIRISHLHLEMYQNMITIINIDNNMKMFGDIMKLL